MDGGSLLASVNIDTASNSEGDLHNDWLYGSPVRITSMPNNKHALVRVVEQFLLGPCALFIFFFHS